MHYKASIICSCYRGEKYLPLFFQSYVNQTIFNDCELVFVHNDPTDEELKIVNTFKEEYPQNINHIIVEREPISVSMNRAIYAASANILVNWDIDDIRTPDSIELQINTFLQYPDISCTYGDFVIVKEFGSKEGRYIHSIEFDQNEFTQSMHCGPFRAWRKKIHDKVGYFDEQLKSGADYDFMIRIAYNYNMKKTEGNLGYYLNAGTGLSTSSLNFISLQERELRVINQRYHIYNKLDYFVSLDTKKYDINRLMISGEKINLTRFISKMHKKKTWFNFLLSCIFSLKQFIARLLKYFYIKFCR